MQQNELLRRYTDTLRRSIPLSIPSLNDEEITKGIEYSIEKRFKDAEVMIDNNYKHKQASTTLSKLADYLLSKKPIMTSYGCIFTRHGTVPNPLYDLIEEFSQTRDNFKKEMFKYVKGSDEFNKYNLLQMVAKVDNNAIYGCLGNYASLYYNIYVAASITRQGRGCISSSIMLFESILANNVKFGSLDEVVTFIDNIRSERKDRKFNDRMVLDRNISLEESFSKVILSCGYRWVPSKRELVIIWDMMSRLDTEDLNRIYYKNNLYEFCNNSRVMSMIINMLCKLKIPFLDPNHPPKIIEEDIYNFLDVIKEYVYYGYQIIDKLDRIEEMPRDVVLITDTDSCIISLDGWYNFMLDKIRDVPMAIKKEQLTFVKRLKVDEFGDREPLDIAIRMEPNYDYDFFDEKIVEEAHLVHPATVFAQDGLRHSIINIMSFCISKLILDYMEKFTMNYNSYAEGKKCLLIMKNEFLFKSIMLTGGKKNYASIQEIQEGHQVPKNHSLVISGLPIDKVGIPKSTGDKLKQIIFNDILDIDSVDQIKILKELAMLEKKILDSINKGETKYHKPARIKSISTYSDPMRIQGIKASVAYNALRDGEEAIDLEKRNSVLIIKVNMDTKTISKIKEKFPSVYNKAVKLLLTPEFKGTISAIAIPFDANIPKWVIPFIDFMTIIHDNLNNFPLESVGINRLDNKNITFSNILSL